MESEVNKVVVNIVSELCDYVCLSDSNKGGLAS